MPTELSRELAQALRESEDGRLELIDPETRRTYVLVDGDLHRQALAALAAEENLDAIREGLKQMEAGEGRDAEQVFEEVRDRFGFSRQS